MCMLSEGRAVPPAVAHRRCEQRHSTVLKAGMGLQPSGRDHSTICRFSGQSSHRQAEDRDVGGETEA